jgi:CheY-like chemotaxis protein
VNPLSVLVVDENPAVLVFIARVLDAGGMRALLARNGNEALDIAKRSYVPIDLILINATFLESDELPLLDQLRELRVGVRDLSMAACVDGDVIRVQPMVGGRGMEPVICDEGLIESIRKSARTPRVRRAGHLH